MTKSEIGSIQSQLQRIIKQIENPRAEAQRNRKLMEVFERALPHAHRLAEELNAAHAVAEQDLPGQDKILKL
ncbi:MAG TPA: hypothetical protein VF669_05840 [Tepidisphaeraceae bacterium]|jgi:hypothetical protein